MERVVGRAGETDFFWRPTDEYQTAGEHAQGPIRSTLSTRSLAQPTAQQTYPTTYIGFASFLLYAWYATGVYDKI